jgi:hypothetical protein
MLDHRGAVVAGKMTRESGDQEVGIRATGYQEVPRGIFVGNGRSWGYKEQ